METTTSIPPITHELGRYWEQPNPKDIVLDDKYALMSRKTFQELKEYNTTNPTGVYEGKMWKRKIIGADKYELCWWSSAEDPEKCTFNSREIIL